MSNMYNFNHHQNHHPSPQGGIQNLVHTNQGYNNLINGVPSNGTATQVRYQVENDFLSRSLVSMPNNLDMSSVQLTRPTSKTAMLVRQRRAMLEQLSCYICKGYLIDATTIDECMDSFCKSCIVMHLRNQNNCPKCGVLIHKTNPLSAIHSDKVLQDIVYKLVPGLYDNEMKRRREFYRNIYGGNATSSSSDSEDNSSGSSSMERSPTLRNEQYGTVSHPKSFYKPNDSIDLSIEPHTRGDSSTVYYDNKRKSIVTNFTGSNQQQPTNGSMFSPVDSQHFKTYLRCPAKLTALQLKKFIAAKFNLCKDDTIHLLYLNESLRDEYSLIDVAYIYDWRGIEHMRLFYIIERDLTKSDYLKEFQAECQVSKKIKLRHSVGTSTQTPKRVCIDPTPKFYEEQIDSNTSNSGDVFNHPSGRTMRPRLDTSSRQTKDAKVAKNQSTTPILRSNASARSDESHQTNDISNRELVPSMNAPRSPFVNAVSTAIGELSRLKQQDNSKETRSTRKQITATKSIPKINIQLHPIHQSQDAADDRAKNTYSKSKHDTTNNNYSQKETAVVQRLTTTRQLVPLMREGYSSVVTSAMINPSQSSMVTLASFTQACSNNLVSMSSSSTTAISNSYKNIQAAGSQFRPETKTVQISKTSQPSSAQMAFSYITERGVTIVRPKFGRDDSCPASTSSFSSTTSIKPATSSPALPPPTMTSTQTIGANNIGTNIGGGISRSAGNLSPYQTSGSPAGSSSGGSNNYDGTTGRHHLKVKPVYKTFVDPTKVKSANCKRLGTARH